MEIGKVSVRSRAIISFLMFRSIYKDKLGCHIALKDLILCKIYKCLYGLDVNCWSMFYSFSQKAFLISNISFKIFQFTE